MDTEPSVRQGGHGAVSKTSSVRPTGAVQPQNLSHPSAAAPTPWPALPATATECNAPLGADLMKDAALSYKTSALTSPVFVA